jgi:uncharacterized protein (DUF2267 family)
MLGLDPWWDEPAYKAAQGTFSERGTFILNKLAQHDASKLSMVLADLYRDEPPDPMDITKFQWQTILAFMGPSEEEIADVQLRMGRVWR